MAMNALLSVSDKTGIVDFAKALHAWASNCCPPAAPRNCWLEGLPVTEVAEVTQFPEMLDGRVKTLHPRCTAACWPAASCLPTWRP